MKGIKTGCSRGVVGILQDCDMALRDFKHQLLYNVYFQTNSFGKGMKPNDPSNYELSSTMSHLFQEYLLHKGIHDIPLKR